MLADTSSMPLRGWLPQCLARGARRQPAVVLIEHNRRGWLPHWLVRGALGARSFPPHRSNFPRHRKMVHVPIANGPILNGNMPL